MQGTAVANGFANGNFQDQHSKGYGNKISAVQLSGILAGHSGSTVQYEYAEFEANDDVDSFQGEVVVADSTLFGSQDSQAFITTGKNARVGQVQSNLTNKTVDNYQIALATVAAGKNASISQVSSLDSIISNNTNHHMMLMYMLLICTEQNTSKSVIMNNVEQNKIGAASIMADVNVEQQGSMIILLREINSITESVISTKCSNSKSIN